MHVALAMALGEGVEFKTLSVKKKVFLVELIFLNVSVTVMREKSITGEEKAAQADQISTPHIE